MTVVGGEAAMWYVEWRMKGAERFACSVPMKWKHQAEQMMRVLMRKDDKDDGWEQPAVIVLCEGLDPVEQVVLKHDGGKLLMPTIGEVLGGVIHSGEDD